MFYLYGILLFLYFLKNDCNIFIFQVDVEIMYYIEIIRYKILQYSVVNISFKLCFCESNNIDIIRDNMVIYRYCFIFY